MPDLVPTMNHNLKFKICVLSRDVKMTHGFGALGVDLDSQNFGVGRIWV